MAEDDSVIADTPYDYEDNTENELNDEPTIMKPELKKLYEQHPECILDYVETIIPKLEQKFVVPGGDNLDANKF